MEEFIWFEVKSDKHFPPFSDVPQVREVIFVLLKHPLASITEIVNHGGDYTTQSLWFPAQALFGPALQCYVCIMVLDHQFSFGLMAQISHADSRWN